MLNIQEVNHKNMHFIQKELNQFSREFYNQFIVAFKELTPPNEIFQRSANEVGNFFQSQMGKDSVNFMAVLISQFPELITDYRETRSRFFEALDNQINIYELMCGNFHDALLAEAINEGVEKGIFIETEGSINLTPNYNSNN